MVLDETNGNEELALWKAIADAANERITTQPKGGSNLRTEIDESMIALYETTGADRVKLKLHEQEVGTLSLQPSPSPRRAWRCA